MASLHTTHGIDLYETPGGFVHGWHQPKPDAAPPHALDLAGSTWLAEDGRRMAQIGAGEVVEVASRHVGIAYFVGGCPDCVCNPVLCESDDTGLHCGDMNCGFCLNGCSEDECEAN